MMFKESSFNPDYLKTVKWSEWKKLCIESSVMAIGNDELEIYKLYRYYTGRKVAGMERKLNG